ncbi:MAG: B12-binding domain-containing radical SAM protein, partial [Verrucomicrobiae bacterium]|nr:B12-binding domain-containing radical SAM protein [Verrucomicrobiae bacterium]
ARRQRQMCIRDRAGIGYRDNETIRLTEPRPFVDLNAQPPLAYELVDINPYRRKMFGADHVAYCSSRGCLYRCGFCYGGVMHKRKWRAKQPERVVEELTRLIRDYGIHGFNLTDDNLFTHLDHAHRVMEQIACAKIKIRIGKLHIRIDAIRRMDNDFLDLLGRVGVERLTIGVESGCQRVLDLIEKTLRVEHVLEASRKLIGRPYVPMYLFMMGLPTETPEEFQQSLRLAEQLLTENPRAAKTFNIYTPYPGTNLYRLAVQMGMKEPQRLEDWLPMNYRNVPKEAPWLAPGMRELISGLDFPLMFLGTNFQFKKTHPVVRALGKLYLPVAQYRVRHMNARFPIESKIVKRLGLFGRQD